MSPRQRNSDRNLKSKLLSRLHVELNLFHLGLVKSTAAGGIASLVPEAMGSTAQREIQGGVERKRKSVPVAGWRMSHQGALCWLT
jgi:hypothetical protein